MEGPPPPDPLTVTAIVPGVVDRLVPGSLETVNILGTAFEVGITFVEIDGVPLSTTFTVLNDTTISFDMPDSFGLGNHTVTVIKGLESDSGMVTIFPNSGATIQVGTGDAGNAVSAAAIPVRLAGQLGQVMLLIASPSNLPSNLPGKIHLDLGANFSQSANLGAYVIGGDGVTDDVISIGGISGIDLFFQPLNVPIPFGWPMAEGNLQHVFLLP
jgi:hypothetical protein